MDEQATKPMTSWEQESSFLPEDYVKSRGERRANLLSLSLFGVMMLAVVAAFFATNKKWMTVRDEKRSINAMYVQEAAKIDELKELESQRDDLIKKAEVTAALVERVPRSLLFAEIVRRMPAEVKLLELELESEQIKRASAASKKSAGVRTLSGAGKKAGKSKDKDEQEDSLVPEYRQTLTLVGVGRDNDNIADYIESLKNCAILTNVELQYIKETKIENAQLRKFELQARIRNGIDARGLVNPDQPMDLPEVLAPEDLVPSTPIILPPSQMGRDGEPLRSGEADTLPSPIDAIESNLSGLRDFGSWIGTIGASPEQQEPEVRWEDIPASIDDVEPASEENETEAATDAEDDSESGAEQGEG